MDADFVYPIACALAAVWFAASFSSTRLFVDAFWAGCFTAFGVIFAVIPSFGV